jgi:release factor glutamine methyltransferase
MRGSPSSVIHESPVESIGAALIRDGARLAAAIGVSFDEGYREAQGLLAHVMVCSRAKLCAAQRDPVPATVRSAYDALIERRASGEPYAYLVGSRGFYGLDFLATPEVLIPRPETELLVEAALERLPGTGPAKVLDLGTGSGVVAITLARLRPRAQVTAVDVSAGALWVARQNAARLGAEHVRFVAGNWYESLPGEHFDLIVSNPPYVASRDRHLAEADLRFEPRIALDGGQDGLDPICRIVRDAPSHLNLGGWLLLEHAYDQAGRCCDLLVAAGMVQVFSLRDLAGIERVSGGRMQSR